MEKISCRSRWRWLVGKQYRITVLDSRWLMQFPRRMINRGRGGGVVLVLSNERKWPARHSGHAWIELKRLRMSRIGSWLVFQFPRRAVSRGLQPVSFSLNRPPCCDFILEFNHVLSFFLSFSMKGEGSSRGDGWRVVGFPTVNLSVRNRVPKRGNTSLNYLWGNRNVRGKSRQAVSICDDRVYYFSSFPE